MSAPDWEEVEHTADVALRVRGATLADLFANAARGMVGLAAGDDPPTEPQKRVRVTLEAPDAETLLVDWLSELVYRMEEEGFIASEVALHTVTHNALEAEVTGRAGGGLQRHIKAVTYHDLSIERTSEGYQATIVFDV